MGNCANNFSYKKTARHGFDFTHSNPSQAPLVFHIKTWPHLQMFDLNDTQNCVEKIIDASLYEGEKIEINLKSSLEVNDSIQSQVVHPNFTLTCQISKVDKYYIINFSKEQQKKFLWRFISDWTPMEEGDIIRMGKTRYRLCKIVHEKQLNPRKIIKNNNDESLSTNSKGIEENRCRICLSSGQTVQNPLICPCKCTGSVKYTHLACLSNWLFDLNMEQYQFVKIRANKSVCQLCKTDIKGTPQYKNMTDMLFGNANNIPPPYSIFETYQKEEEGGEKDYFIISFRAKSSYTFGRCNKADICDNNDKCISKLNTQIVYKNRKLMINDCDSTHGTFMKVRDNVKLYTSHHTEDIAYRNMIIKARYIPKYQRE